MKIAKRCPCCGGEGLRRSPAVLMPFVANRGFGREPVAITAAAGLRDLLPGHACSVCNTLGCTACGLVFLDMRFDDDEMAALYADYRGPEYCRKRERFEPGYSARNAILNEGSTYFPSIEAIQEAHVPERPRVLDWGGDTGVNTPFRQRAAVLDMHDRCPLGEVSLLPGAAASAAKRP